MPRPLVYKKRILVECLVTWIAASICDCLGLSKTIRKSRTYQGDGASVGRWWRRWWKQGGGRVSVGASDHIIFSLDVEKSWPAQSLSSIWVSRCHGYFLPSPFLLSHLLKMFAGFAPWQQKNSRNSVIYYWSRPHIMKVSLYIEYCNNSKLPDILIPYSPTTKRLEAVRWERKGRWERRRSMKER